MILGYIDSTNPESQSKSGKELAEPGRNTTLTRITAQVVPTSEDEFQVLIEAAVNDPKGKDWEPIGEITQSSKPKLLQFDISFNVIYRFRHISGIRCKVKMVG